MERTLRARPLLLWLAALASAVVLSLCATLAYTSFDDLTETAEHEPAEPPFQADDDLGDDIEGSDDESAQLSFAQPLHSVREPYPAIVHAITRDRAPPNHILDLEPRPPCAA